jgi:hypothetical protein
MANLTSVLKQLRDERKQAQSEVQKLDTAITMLEDLVGRDGAVATQRGSRGGRSVSAAARRRMAAAQRARWARVRQLSKTPHDNKLSKTPSAKRTLSAAARRKIAAAQRARWARVRAQQGEKAKRH